MQRKDHEKGIIGQAMELRNCRWRVAKCQARDSPRTPKAPKDSIGKVRLATRVSRDLNGGAERRRDGKQAEIPHRNTRRRSDGDGVGTL